MGATRRLNHYDADLGWWPLFAVAAAGVVLISLGAALQVRQLWVSVRDRKQNLDLTGDPWDGRTLEWSTTSPPPLYNFAVIPEVTDHDSYWYTKQKKESAPVHYEDIMVPHNSPLGLFIGGLSFLVGFGLVWHIMWLAAASLAGIIVILIFFLPEETEYCLTAQEVQRMESKTP